MELVRWRPRSYVPSVSNEIDRAFDRMVRNWVSPVSFSESDWNPSIDVSESENEIVVKAEVPGVDPGDVEISVDSNNLIISGEKRQEEEEKDRNYYRLERSYGSFRRSFALPADVDVDKIKASSKDGVISVVIPKSGERKSKKVKIEAES
ncbi:MAG: Hsp20/alpha crystallin family protein [Candidatus Eisenbacteria bacterium]|nr:Hsp20/alpha crystallin family protein [Candidatus Eisenbacteria bacterium]